MPSAIDYHAGWQRVPDNTEYDNAFKAQWELFLMHCGKHAPFPWTLLEGARGVQLAEKAIESWAKRCWMDVEPLEGEV